MTLCSWTTYDANTERLAKEGAVQVGIHGDGMMVGLLGLGWMSEAAHTPRSRHRTHHHEEAPAPTVQVGVAARVTASNGRGIRLDSMLAYMERPLYWSRV